MPEPITLTEEELQKKIDDAVNKAKADQEAELKKKHDSEMAQLRIKEKEEREKAIKKAQEDANLSAEEKAKKELEEKQKQADEERKAEKEELEKLRLEKKINDRAKKLTDQGLPEFLKNDVRLLNADEEKVDEVVATIKKEYESVLPEGATITTNVRGGKTPPPDKFAGFRKEGVTKQPKLVKEN